jgi:hypothetical protein
MLLPYSIKKIKWNYCARLGSPLAIGIGEGEYFIASDASPFIEYTSNAVYLEDGEMAVIRLHKSMSVRKLKMIQWLPWYSRAENEFGANWKGRVRSLHAERDLRAT